ncbi:SOS response-associated peptidase [Paenibacillus sp. GD4]|uniref:SOS response-associated peptidase n=1 Tax=Paenibacillus sp. GD4 TaxID=3068890 RepID=UPI00279648DA|nr:SOS response-associated peptidase [Paenibacillus sp. GD4]MDQ1909466.1 SOS response-associated peptidase [Paenibacillus sp. GD4]
MCGRFTITVSWDELILRFLLDSRPGKYQPRYNAAPGQWIPAILGTDRRESSWNRIGELRWGLVPSWASDERAGAKMLNIRSETVSEKPAFRRLLQRKRCLIPADGFYEWKGSGRQKQPYRFLLRSGEPFGMAALYDTWAASDGSKLHTCTILTTNANELVSEVHHRMPVILSPEGEKLWLDRDIQTSSELTSLLQPYASDRMRSYEVDAKVGSVRWDEPACIEPMRALL